ncbi:Soluble P-type ATPase [Desulfonatronum thiosulfatophilum]|uniref:Soluble P-type ATPase n=1 Tax=Desulfonatronum thiosulfatophilum TaxID=617002 RepID=A0A1G6CHW1_9BACT|nr:HAD family hydrolase [Desulfonatronum thiosulfatophilum]SDB32335.1 Soluble P-type ATPase [Desulfonatronum thiosulfatophilum]
MLSIDIPGWKTLHLDHLFLDYNGTLALDGKVLPGVRERLQELAVSLEIHVLTADTFGSVREELGETPCDLLIIPDMDQAKAKADYLESFKPSGSVAVGNGRNDALMLQKAALGIALLQDEGSATQTLNAADVVCRSILDALDLLRKPLRLTATLRD